MQESLPMLGFLCVTIAVGIGLIANFRASRRKDLFLGRVRSDDALFHRCHDEEQKQRFSAHYFHPDNPTDKHWKLPQFLKIGGAKYVYPRALFNPKTGTAYFFFPDTDIVDWDNPIVQNKEMQFRWEYTEPYEGVLPETNAV